MGKSRKPFEWELAGGIACGLLGVILLFTAVMEWKYQGNHPGASGGGYGGYLGAGLVLVFLGTYFVTQSQTNHLVRKVRAIAPVKGKTESAVRRALGRPVSVEEIDGEETLLTWVSPGYRLTLAFRDGVCTRVAREQSGRSG